MATIVYSAPPDTPLPLDSRRVSLSYQLPVLAGDIILVPGCEPSSELSSFTLTRAMDCGKATVKLADVLEAIPGSYIWYTVDSSNGSVRKKFVVFPPIQIDCSCQPYPDFYAILKTLANEEAPIVEAFNHCDVIGQGFCPSPGWRNTPAPEPNMYQPEGYLPSGVANIVTPPMWNSPPPPPPAPSGPPSIGPFGGLG